MSLAMLLYPPPTENGLEEWAYHHFQHHLVINRAITTLRQQKVDEFNIYPFQQNPAAFQNFLAQNQKWHDGTNNILGVSGVDLRSVDFSNAQQRDAWIWLHWNQHRAWAVALGNGI